MGPSLAHWPACDHLRGPDIFPRHSLKMLKTTATHSIRVFHLFPLTSCSKPLKRHFNARSLLGGSIFPSRSSRSAILTRPFFTSRFQWQSEKSSGSSNNKPTLRENIYTLPNLLTLSRICACPVLGWSILDGNYHLATGLLVYAGLTDLVRDFA